MAKYSDLIKRVAKYDAKVNGANVTAILTAAKPYMVQEANYQFEEQYILERKIKLWFAQFAPALDPINLGHFLAFGKAAHKMIKKHVGATLITELGALCTLWGSRGGGAASCKDELLVVEGITVP